MEDLRELYQELILDHSRHPRNFRVPVPCTHQADGYNPLCGDRLSVHLHVTEDALSDIGFQGTGCAISKAAASTMTEALHGQPIADAKALFETFRAVVMGKQEPNVEELGKLAVFAGVAAFPMRVKCATLAWHTLVAALAGEDKITTE